ncbi:MAG TPA: carbamoyltransferase HypF, partial [Candidatus Krumholzibacterium sp.]|nr:carbamoyltransferase HypF [Candidatus Krumholzibacterium sp.]
GADSAPIAGDPIDEARKIIGGGGILALKGLGGYHLACMATDGKSVQLLRQRKRRPSKPFALMFSSVASVREYCHVTGAEEALLTSPEAPIVLLRGKKNMLPGSIAPGNSYIGAFLPYTPVHHLIIRDFEVLVMTSANFTDEPLISTESELTAILGTIADAALTNDRRIAHKCDDSIVFAPGGMIIPLRRARGFVPEPVKLPQFVDRCILGVGGQEKGTFTLTRGDQAFVSAHLGDLGDARGQENYRKEYNAFCSLLEVRPDIVVCDMHPDYFTTRFAEGLDCQTSVSVQHHHAHAVSVMVEYGLEGPVIGVSFDGTGFGTDGNLWGGEFLLAWHHDFRRLAHLKYVPLPGGAVAVREPWRMALAYLREGYGDDAAVMRLPGISFSDLPAARMFEMIDRNINTYRTSSAGRLFDAVACILGQGYRVSDEAQAAIALESLVPAAARTERIYPFKLSHGEPASIDCGPVIEGVVNDLTGGKGREEISAVFHNTMARMITDVAGDLARRHKCRQIVMSGGVFQNRLLCERIIEMSTVLPFDFLFHRTVPPNDGGISLGQVQAGLAKMIKGII